MNPGVLAPVEWHVGSSYPLYSPEASAKWHLYPPPYGGSYATPWLWIDGKSRGYSYSGWENYVYDELLVPSDVSLTHVGTTYSPGTHAGQVQVECYNAGTVPIVTAALQVVITEDSLYYAGPNGDDWHNHVARDYVPDQRGTTLTLGPGATDTVTVAYALDTSWVEEKVKLVVYLQNMTVQADSSMLCYQGLIGNVLNFVPGVEESEHPAPGVSARVSPNPCRTGCEFVLSGQSARGARVTVYAPDGRLVSTMSVRGPKAWWSRGTVARGIYMYRVSAGGVATGGKLVVTD